MFSLVPEAFRVQARVLAWSPGSLTEGSRRGAKQGQGTRLSRVLALGRPRVVGYEKNGVPAVTRKSAFYTAFYCA